MKPFVRGTPGDASEALIVAWMGHYGVDRAEAVRLIAENDTQEEIWVNDLYQVMVHRDPENQAAQLNIRRRDGKVILRDWRHFQEIKNQLVGPECEAVELYPAESRLVDTSNKYHLFCSTDPTFRFPFGWKDRDVLTGKGPPGVRGMRQRPIITSKKES